MGKTMLRAALAGWAVVACLGCYSDSPLDQTPQLPLDTAILGTWRCLPADPGSNDTAVVTVAADPEAPREYQVTWQEPDKKADHYRAFASSVGGATFVNVRSTDPESADAGWAFLRYSLLRSNVLYLELVQEAPFKEKGSSATPAAARAALEHALAATPGAVQGFAVCVGK